MAEYFGGPAGTAQLNTNQEQFDILDEAGRQAQAGFAQERTDTQTSFARQRQDLINSFQSALDEIGLALKNVGIQTRGQFAQRGLYDPSGEVSGIGQGVAAQNVAPYLSRIGNLQTQQSSAIAGLGERERASLADISQREQELPLTLRQKRLELKERIAEGVSRAAREAAQDKIDLEQQDFENRLALSREQRLAVEQAQSSPTSRAKLEADGYEYLGTQRAVREARRSGRTVVTIGGKRFALSPEREADLQSKRALTSQRLRPSRSTRTTTPKLGAVSKEERGSTGGFNFFRKNPDGSRKQIGAIVFADQQGVSIEDVLAGSKDPKDQYILSAVKQLRGVASEDEIRQALQADYPELFAE